MGALLFKLLMQKAVIGMRAIYYYLRENLTNLETHTETLNSNIDTFNQHVMVTVEGLDAILRVQTT